jgi:hypothetical protein
MEDKKKKADESPYEIEGLKQMYQEAMEYSGVINTSTLKRLTALMSRRINSVAGLSRNYLFSQRLRSLNSFGSSSNYS